jgi:WD40-like Beta Propeller Repeat
VCATPNPVSSETHHCSDTPSISADGRYVAFSSDAPDVVAGDTNDAQDVFVHDTRTITTTRVSVAADGSQATCETEGFCSRDPVISADGRYVAFQSRSSTLVRRDTNRSNDVFIRGPLPPGPFHDGGRLRAGYPDELATGREHSLLDASRSTRALFGLRRPRCVTIRLEHNRALSPDHRDGEERRTTPPGVEAVPLGGVPRIRQMVTFGNAHERPPRPAEYQSGLCETRPRSPFTSALIGRRAFGIGRAASPCSRFDAHRRSPASASPDAMPSCGGA